MTRLEGVTTGYCTSDDHHAEVPKPIDCIIVDGKEICLECLIEVATPYLIFREDCPDLSKRQTNGA